MLVHPAMLWLIDTDFERSNGYGTKMSPRNQIVPLVESEEYVIDATNSAALSTMASSTGCTSVGERLMMPSTSAVAV